MGYAQAAQEALGKLSPEERAAFVEILSGILSSGRPFDLPFMVEQWDDTDSQVEDLIALTGDYRVARAAFEEAVKRRPGRIVTLRQKT